MNEIFGAFGAAGFASRESGFGVGDVVAAEFDRVGGFASLRGALVTPDQVARWAPALAEALGLRVVEDVS